MIEVFFTRQFARFVVVGALAAFLHWLSRVGLSFWLPFSWAVAAAYLVGMTVAFILNSLFVFPDSDKPRGAQIRDFVLINLAFFPVVWFVSVQIEAILQSLGLLRHSKELAHAIAIPIPMLATFLLYKFLAFRQRTYEQQ